MSSALHPSTPRLRPWLLSAPAIVLFMVMVAAPLAMTVTLSFGTYEYASGIKPGFSLANYIAIITDDYFREIFLRTFGIALSVTVLCAVIGTPEAYILHRMGKPWKSLCMLVILGPLLISVVVRTLGWALLLGRNGAINGSLLKLGLLDQPLSLLYTVPGVIVALVHVLVPFMVISVWAALQKLSPEVERAALSLGAGQFTLLTRIVIPQVIPGLLSGSLIVFALAASAFATPAIIGGRQNKVVATTIYDEFLSTLNWPVGAAIAVCLLAANIVIMLTYNRLLEQRYSRTSG